MPYRHPVQAETAPAPAHEEPAETRAVLTGNRGLSEVGNLPISQTHLTATIIFLAALVVLGKGVPGTTVPQEIFQEACSVAACALVAWTVLTLVWRIQTSRSVRWGTTLGTTVLMVRMILFLLVDAAKLSDPPFLTSETVWVDRYQNLSSDFGLFFLLAGFICLIFEISQKNRRLAGEVIEREHLLNRVHNANKLESLGILAGGIAHDFNNLLTRISGNVSLALDDVAFHSPIRDNLIAIDSAVSRGAQLAKQMLAYSGKGKFMLEPLNLSELVGESTHWLRASLPDNCHVHLQLRDSLPVIEADTTQMSQMMVHLFTNAVEALGEPGGEIVVSTGQVDIDEEWLTHEFSFNPILDRPYIFLKVSDTGGGMDRFTRDKMFDPFFSTKSPGRGLGMAAVLGIIRSHHGLIQVESARGVGTTVWVLFPSMTPAESQSSDSNLEARFAN